MIGMLYDEVHKMKKFYLLTIMTLLVASCSSNRVYLRYENGRAYNFQKNQNKTLLIASVRLAGEKNVLVSQKIIVSPYFDEKIFNAYKLRDELDAMCSRGNQHLAQRYLERHTKVVRQYKKVKEQGSPLRIGNKVYSIMLNPPPTEILDYIEKTGVFKRVYAGGDSYDKEMNADFVVLLKGSFPLEKEKNQVDSASISVGVPYKPSDHSTKKDAVSTLPTITDKYYYYIFNGKESKYGKRGLSVVKISGYRGSSNKNDKLYYGFDYEDVGRTKMMYKKFADDIVFDVINCK